jgi:hypothetical protein
MRPIGPISLKVSLRAAIQYSFLNQPSDKSAELPSYNPQAWPRKYSSQTSVDFDRKAETNSTEFEP